MLQTPGWHRRCSAALLLEGPLKIASKSITAKQGGACYALLSEHHTYRCIATASSSPRHSARVVRHSSDAILQSLQRGCLRLKKAAPHTSMYTRSEGAGYGCDLELYQPAMTLGQRRAAIDVGPENALQHLQIARYQAFRCSVLHSAS